MGQLIFRNKWVALIWVIGLLASLGAFFSKGGGVEALDQTVDRMRSQQAVMQKQSLDDQASLEPAAEAEEPAVEASETPTPEPGDLVTGEDGRRYRVVGTAPAEPAPTEPAAN
jgi:hypothetical protein